MAHHIIQAACTAQNPSSGIWNCAVVEIGRRNAGVVEVPWLVRGNRDGKKRNRVQRHVKVTDWAVEISVVVISHYESGYTHFPPASSKRTFHFPFSDRRDATVLPPTPAPYDRKVN